MSRTLLFAPLLLAIACRPNAPVDDKRVHAAAPSSLIRAYRDTPRLADQTWTGHYVACELNAGDYQVTRTAVHLFTGAPPSAHPCMIFECTFPPADNTKTITLVGKCKGAARDGVERGSGVGFCLVFESCTVR